MHALRQARKGLDYEEAIETWELALKKSMFLSNPKDFRVLYKEVRRVTLIVMRLLAVLRDNVDDATVCEYAVAWFESREGETWLTTQKLDDGASGKSGGGGGLNNDNNAP